MILLFAGIVLLLGAHVAIGVIEALSGSQINGPLVDLVHVNVEANLTSAFATGQLAFASLLLLGIARRAARAGSQQSLYWLVLGVGFAYMAVDEGARIHERLGPWLMGDLQPGGPGGPFRHVWVIPAMGIVAIVGVAFIPFLRRLPMPTRVLLIAAGAIYVMGAIGGEMLGAVVAAQLGRGSAAASVMTLEEAGELFGVLILIHALLGVRARGARPADVPAGSMAGTAGLTR